MIKIQNNDLDARGKQALITKQQPLLNEICEKFGRDPKQCCIKVFYGNPLKEGEPLENALWGDPPSSTDVRKNTTVLAGSQVQNILWKHGLSPRVYTIFEGDLNGQRVACALVEFVKGLEAQQIEEVYDVWNKTEEIGKNYGFTAPSKKMSPADVINGKNIDPQLWAFDNKPYKEVVQQIYYAKGKYGKVYYQNDADLGFRGGPRKSEDRIKYMQLDKIDFEGKVVWDVGCAGGFFCRYAYKRGAKRVIGFDESLPLEAAFHVGNYLGMFNIDYVVADLLRGIPLDTVPKADIAFFLSMNYHVPVPKQITELVDTVIFEDNGKVSREKNEPEDIWKKHYSQIELVGHATDHGNKPCYHLKR